MTPGADPNEPEPACTWCGAAVAEDDGFRLFAAAGDGSAIFCRLEHIVPWAITRPEGGWDRPARSPEAPAAVGAGTETGCAHCGGELGSGRLELVRHRGPHRIPDRFCSRAHLLAWAKAGGRWRSSGR